MFFKLKKKNKKKWGKGLEFALYHPFNVTWSWVLLVLDIANKKAHKSGFSQVVWFHTFHILDRAFSINILCIVIYVLLELNLLAYIIEMILFCVCLRCDSTLLCSVMFE